jgi:hypothetical protein
VSNQVELIQHKDVYNFNQRVRDFLLRNEALHHAMLSQCYALTYTPEPVQIATSIPSDRKKPLFLGKSRLQTANVNLVF